MRKQHSAMDNSRKQQSHARPRGDWLTKAAELALPRPLRVSVISHTQRAVVAFLKWHILQAIRLSGSPLRELSVVIAPDGLMRRLHQKFFDDPTLTDVITFPLEQDERGHAISGEVYLSLTVARRQAQVRGIPTRHELLLYAIHGMLHLSDYDDLTPRKYQAMHKEEDRILQQLGFGPVFGRADAAASRKPRLNLSENG